MRCERRRTLRPQRDSHGGRRSGAVRHPGQAGLRPAGRSEHRALEAEKAALEASLSSGTLPVEELTAQSRRIAELIASIDEKTMRWLELSER